MEAGLGQVAITSGHMDQVLVLASSWIRGKEGYLHHFVSTAGLQNYSSVFVNKSFHEHVKYKGTLLRANNEITINILGRCVILILLGLFAPREQLVMNYALENL